MKYQLVLQWPASSIRDYDAMLEIEQSLTKNLSEANDVDGHDAGSNEVNLFIKTNDPKRTFIEIKTILGSRDFWIDARVAYREIEGVEYTILWPPGLIEFKVK